MSWLTPAFGAIAAAIAIPTLIVLYFLKLRRRDVEISTTLLWKKAVQDMQANAPFQKLRKNILLFLQLIALAGIAAALAQPQIKSQALEGQMYVLMIDRSASMGATDATPDGKSTRLELAKKQALAIVDSLREGGLFGAGEADKAMVISFDAAGSVVQSFTSDKTQLKNAIESITATDAPTSMKMAMELARANVPKRVMIDADGTRREIAGLSTAESALSIHVFSDGRIPDVANLAPGRDDSVEYHALGTPEAVNVGIVSIRAERGYENPNHLTIFVGLSNNQLSPRSVDVELTIDNQPVGLKNVNIASASVPNAVKSAAPAPDAAAEAPTPQSQERSPGIGGAVFELERAEGALVQIALRDPSSPNPPEGDVLRVDDRAWLVVPPAKRLSVALVTRGSLFLSSVVNVLPIVPTFITPEQLETLINENRLGEHDVYVLDGYLPKAGVGDAGLPPGRFIVLGSVPAGAKSGLTDRGKGPATSFIDWSREHPVTRNLALDAATFAESRLVDVQAGSAATTLAMTSKGPAIIELATADTRAIVVPANVAESNWPFQESWVVFMGASIYYVGEDGSRTGALRSVQPGWTLSDRLPAGVASAQIAAPQASPESLTPAPDGRFVFGPVQRIGVYTVTWSGDPTPVDLSPEPGKAARVYAANLLDSAESDPRTLGELPLASKIVKANAQTPTKADRNLWPWFLLGVLGLIMLEWFIYNRKVHV